MVTKTKVKPVAQAIGHQPLHAEHSESAFAKAYSRFEQAREDLLEFFSTPSWKRQIVALVATCALAAGLSALGMTLTEYMVAGAVVAGSGTFVQLAIFVLGIVITCRIAYRVAVRVGGAVLTGEADERAIAAYDSMRELAAKLNPFKRWHANTSVAR